MNKNWPAHGKKKKVVLHWMAGAWRRHHLGALQSLGYLPVLIFFSAHTNDLLRPKVRNKVRLSQRAFFSPFNIKVREIMVCLWSFPGTAYVSLHGVYNRTDCGVSFLWERRRRWSGYGLKKGVYSFGARANLLHANEQTSNGVLELRRHLLAPLYSNYNNQQHHTSSLFGVMKSLVCGLLKLQMRERV